ncbi:hypothetical protein V2J09_022786 [Rumex salicifolius]
MGSNDPLPFIPRSPYSNDIDTMRHWEQFPMGNDLSESNFQFDYTPPLKRVKSSNDDLQTSAAYLTINLPRMSRANPPINPPGKIFFKTRLCAKFRMGQCRNGENCNFAHGEDDMRQPPHNWQELVAGRADDRGGSVGNWEDDEKIIHRMKLCKKFYNGEECPYGERCNFLHKEPPKHRDTPGSVRLRESPRESSAISIGITRPPIVQQTSGLDQLNANKVVVEAGFDATRGNIKPVYWKMRICSKWEITGHCPFGENCHFAHGHTDLQMSGVRPGEPELVNSVSGLPNPLTLGPVNEPPVATRIQTDIAPASNQHGNHVKKCLLKWNPNKKINSIYADWIDDMPLNFPNEVES